ncbi:MAG: hypothetical protein FWD53_04860 [Phycisphaerales bacterium]|nr:hypothetical protein [Phycisphaerales bacterium]
MVTIALEQFQRDVADAFRRVEAGETLVVLRDDKPIAEIKPAPEPEVKPKGRRPSGLYKGILTVPDDIMDPLPDDILKYFEGT